MSSPLVYGKHPYEKDGFRVDKLYNFYSTPDYEKGLEKTYYYTKYAATAGAVFSVYEMVLNSQPKTAYASIARFGRFTFPLAGMGAIYGSAVCVTAQIRKKSDFVNHVIAGALAGAMFGVKFRSISLGHTMAVFGAFFGGYIKFFDDHDIPKLNLRTPEMRMNIPNMDFSIHIYDDPGRPKP